MSFEAIGATAPAEGNIISADTVAGVPNTTESTTKPTGLHSPPDSNNAMKLDGSDDSDLSDLDDAVAAELNIEQAPADEDIGEVEPAEYSGTVPVFKPTMHQFKDFKKFMAKVDKYGMKSGIIKIVPPQEWKDALPALDDIVKPIRVREPIKQDIMGSNGTYRQVNILHQRSYNLPQWRQLCDQSEHQPPARRGERRANADKPKAAPKPRAAAPAAAPSTTRRSRRGRPGRPKKGRAGTAEGTAEPDTEPMTPESEKADDIKTEEDAVVDSIEQEIGIKIEEDDDAPPIIRRMGFSRQAPAKTQSTSARRKYAKREGSAKIDEAAFKDWDYRMDISDYTPERCEELERTYWKTLTYAPPLYGADLPGTLFHEDTELWNLNKLPNLLDVLGTKVPGVNTAYLYLGMWKATFAWHLEDVDLYSINYLHFGAPKQWYSISQGDARRFEAAMKNIWPTEAKACDQFLRHKAFLISPSHLLQHYNIKVNKCVSYPGEFVVTYPYGYHSGYNLGYNCAEAVNFALDSWLPMGKIAKKCECAEAQDSVWVDVYEIERKLRGESTEYEVSDDEDEEDEDDDHEGSVLGLPTPPASHGRVKAPRQKRKRATGDKEGKKKVKKIRLRVKSHVEPPCCLCPNDIPGAEILPTDDGRKAHRVCALYLPETYIETMDDKETIAGVATIDKARLDLKCLYCHSKRGACFQCSQKKCARSYHATCAPGAGVFVEEADVPVFDDEGVEYKEQAFEFSCRFHRTKRDRKFDGEALFKDRRIREAASALKKNDICQLQFYRADIFAGVVVENNHDEQTLLIDVVPNGDRVEVEWKWLLLPDPADFKLPKASANALPMPTTKLAKDQLNAKKRPGKEMPRADDPFLDGFTWAEFHTCEPAECQNKEQVKVELAKAGQMWYYLGATSTESKAQYTHDVAQPIHNPKSNFLDSIPKPVVQRPSAASAAPRRSYSAIVPPYVPHSQTSTEEKPYVYKPRKPIDAIPGRHFTSQQFTPRMPNQVGTPAPQPAPHAGEGRFRVMMPTVKKVSPPAASQASQSAPQPTNMLAPSPMSSHATSSSPQTWAIPTKPASATNHFVAPFTMPGNPASAATPSNGGIIRPHHAKHGHRRHSTTPIPVPNLPGHKSQLTSGQKHPFFQVNHNRDPNAYKTPYAPWGGFTNGYEGSLRAHLMKTPTTASIHKRSSSFGLGGGLMGLTRPAPHLNYSSPPSTSSSSSPSPYYPPLRTPNFGTVSSASSFSSYDAMMNGHAMPPTSPVLSQVGSYATGRPVTPMGGYDLAQTGIGPLHPAIRPQYGPVWQQQPFPAPLNQYAQADVNFSPPSPIASSASAMSPNMHTQPAPFMNGMSPLLEFGTPSREASPPPESSGTRQSPAEQLKQQLRRISDPPPSSYRFRCLHQPKRRHQSRSSLNRIFTSQLLDFNPT